jgi:hypothetical protein
VTITIRHAQPSPLPVPIWTTRFENRNSINYIAAALSSFTITPRRSPGVAGRRSDDQSARSRTKSRRTDNGPKSRHSVRSACPPPANFRWTPGRSPLLNSIPANSKARRSLSTVSSEYGASANPLLRPVAIGAVFENPLAGNALMPPSVLRGIQKPKP